MKLIIDVKRTTRAPGLLEILEEGRVKRAIDRRQENCADMPAFSFLVCAMSWAKELPSTAEKRHQTAFEEMDYNVETEIRGNSGKEQFSDGALHNAINALLDNENRPQNFRPSPGPGPPQVLVLVTGDGNLNSSKSTFPKACEKVPTLPQQILAPMP